MTKPLDPRIFPYRDDLAATSLKGHVTAPRYIEGAPASIATASVPLATSPREDAEAGSQLLFGERVTVFERKAGWAWVQSHHDAYMGYVPETVLSEALEPPTHRVSVPLTLLFPAPDIKRPPLATLSLSTPLAVIDQTEKFVAIENDRWIFAKHVTRVGVDAPDPVATAARLMGTPYLWGGRSAWGIDCSGLVQIALSMAGRSVARDSDLQEASIGVLISPDGAGHGFQRGDIVFFPGHVGFMEDDTTLLHATAFTLSVTREPVSVVAARAGGITAVRRIVD